MKKLFGTDGMRGVAGDYPLDPPTIHALGRALVALMRAEGLPARVLIGRDTRESGGWIEDSLARGVRAAMGPRSPPGHSDVGRLLPDPPARLLGRDRHLRFAQSLPRQRHQDLLLGRIQDSRRLGNPARASAPGKGRSGQASPQGDGFSADHYARDYRDFLYHRLEGFKPVRRLKVVVDAANGAASGFAPAILTRLGFDVIKMSVTPNGRNINAACGSLHPQRLAGRVVEEKADIGIAYDGDADRALWVDERGASSTGTTPSTSWRGT